MGRFKRHTRELGSDGSRQLGTLGPSGSPLKARRGAVAVWTLCGAAVLSAGVIFFISRSREALAQQIVQTMGVSRHTSQKVVQVQAGEALHLTASHPLSHDGTGSWSASFGYVSADGLYAAPTSVPAGGLDLISYSNEKTGESFYAAVQIVPNAGAPISPKAPNLAPLGSSSVTDPAFAADSEPSMPMPGLAGGSAPQQKIQTTNSTLNPNAFTQATPINPQVVNGKALYRLPLINGAMAHSSVKVYASVDGAQPLLMSSHGPLCQIPSWAGQTASGSQLRYVLGPICCSADRSGLIDGSVTVDAAMRRQVIKWCGSAPKLGVMSVSFKELKLHAWQFFDVYQPVNGVWKYAYSDRRDQYSDRYSDFAPRWYVHMLGYTSDPHIGDWEPKLGLQGSPN